MGLAALVRYVEGSGDSDQRPSWMEEATRGLRAQSDGAPLGRLDQYLDNRDLQRLYREQIAPRLSGEASEPEPTTLRERIRSR